MFAVVTLSAGVLIKPEKTVITPAFSRLYQQVLKLNESRFKDLDKIQIGDTVLFPSQVGEFTEGWVADAPYNGVHDCIWRLTEKYMLGQLLTEIVPDPEEKNPSEVSQDSTQKSFMFGLLFRDIVLGLLALILLAMLIAWLLITYFKKMSAKRHAPANPDQNPVIPGGLSNNPAIALAQINVAYPTRPRATKVQKVVLEAPAGVSQGEVMMTFADGVRKSIIRAGELATRVERVDNSVDFCRDHCGNLIGEVYRGIYNLPEGWSYRLVNAEAEYVVPETSDKEEERADNAAAKPAGIPLDASSPAGEEVIKIMETMKNNDWQPLTLNYGSFRATFVKSKKQKNKKEEEEK